MSQLDDNTHFLLFKKKMESLLILFIYFLKENEIKNKTLYVTSYLDKDMFTKKKPSSISEFRLPIGKVQ